MSQQGIYSELKPAWWFAQDGGLPEAPKQVQLILSDLCNQDCHFCAYRMSGYSSNELFVGDSEVSAYGHDNPKRMIPTKRALSLLEEFAELGVLGVQFTGGGEPTVHKNHEDIFEKCLSLGMKASLVSNGVRWSQPLIKELLPRFSWVRVSIDAGTREFYAETRRTPVANWHGVWNNVEQLAAEIEKQDTIIVPIGSLADNKTALGLGFVVTPQSWTEIEQFTKLAEESGAHNVRFSAMFSTDNEHPFVDIYDEITMDIEGVREKYESSTFKVYDNFGSRFEDLKQHAPDYSFCSYQFYTAYVGGDLNAYRCCVLAYNQRGKIKGGDLKERSFAEFWKSQDLEEDFSAFDASGCERCQFNEKNRAMNYLMQLKPLHREFP